MIHIGIQNKSDQQITVPLFDERVNANADFAEGYQATDEGLYADGYKNITGWNRALYPNLYTREISNFLYFYLTETDRNANTNAVAYIPFNSILVCENALPTIGNVTISSFARQFFTEVNSADYINYLQMDTLPGNPFTATLNIYTISAILPSYTATVTSAQLMNGISLPDVQIPQPPFGANLIIDLIPITPIVLPVSTEPSVIITLLDNFTSLGVSTIFKVFGK